MQVEGVEKFAIRVENVLCVNARSIYCETIRTEKGKNRFIIVCFEVIV